MPYPSPALAEAFRNASTHFDLPVELISAWSYATTGWDARGYRYEPDVDRVNVTGQFGVWACHPEWIDDGPSADDFFVYHPDRRAERRADRAYDFVAQTRIAARYGPCLLSYPIALRNGFLGDPHELQSVDEGVHWAVAALANELAEFGREDMGALAFSLRKVAPLEAVEAAHRSLYGEPFF